MLYNDATIQFAEDADYFLHLPMTRAVEGHLRHGQVILAGNNLQEILRECRRENNYKEGHYVTDREYNVFHA